jgi:SAM-dependent methyltransferase
MVRRLDGERCAREQVYRLALQMLDSLNMIAPRLRAQQDLQERIHMLGGALVESQNAVVSWLEAERTLRDLSHSMSAQLLGSVNVLVRRQLDKTRERLASEGTLASALRETVNEMVAASQSAHSPGPTQPEEALRDALDELRSRIIDEVTDQTRQVAAIASRVASLEKAAEVPLAETVASAPAERRIPVAGAGLPADVAVPEFDFLAFEALTRGAEESVSAGQRQYLPWFEGARDVLDAGCGRGEFLELLRGAGITARGIDSDPRMVERCGAKGLRVEQATLFEHLTSLPDGSLGGIFLGQVVEHLTPPELAALAPLAFCKLKPGAAFIAETINPMCLTTFSGAFYADPTHVRPVHPKALEHFLRSAGFGAPEIILSAPVPETDRLAPLRETAPLEPHVKALVLQANANIQRLNALLYSFGNYALAARKPAA